MVDQVTFVDSLRATWRDETPTIPAVWIVSEAMRVFNTNISIIKQEPVTRTVVDILQPDELRIMTHNALRKRLSIPTCISLLLGKHSRSLHQDWDSLQAEVLLANAPSNDDSSDLSPKFAQQQFMELIRH